MKSRKVLAYNNMPTRLPLWQTITCWLALDHWNAPQWLYGAMVTFFIFAWAYCFISFFTEKRLDLLGNNKNNNQPISTPPTQQSR